MTNERECQTCGHKAVASCTGKTVDSFGMVWPGGRKQQGYVPPHHLIGLRERGASSDYVNFSWCLVCGQIQGEWPTQAGSSHLIKYAEPRLWEVVICSPPTQASNYEARYSWHYRYFMAKTKEIVDAHVMDNVDNFERFFVTEIAKLPPNTTDVEELG